MQSPNPMASMRRLTTEISRSGILRTHPVVVLDAKPSSGLEKGDEEDLYEEIEDEEEDDMNGEADYEPSASTPEWKEKGFQSAETYRCASSALGNFGKPFFSDAKRCVVCSRQHGGRIRLFRWPRDERTRVKWCSFLGLDDKAIARDYRSVYICSGHFDSEQFLSINGKIYWALNAFPRYKSGKCDNGDIYPWEMPNCDEGAYGGTSAGTSAEYMASHVSLGRKMSKCAAKHKIGIRFRQSNYKVLGRTKHPVAVVSRSDHPSLCYEFSYNRTSDIDGTKFYSCLQCRKAKLDTGVKDIIRTIHLDGTRLLSKGDPMVGHHFACKPLLEKTSCRRGIGEVETIHEGMLREDSDQEEHFAEELDCEKDVDSLSAVSSSQQPSVSQKTSRNESDIPWKPLHALALESRIKKKYGFKVSRRLIPKCYLCFRVCSGLQQLISHLSKHFKSASACHVCSLSIDPAENFSGYRRLKKLCKRCSMAQRLDKDMGGTVAQKKLLLSFNDTPP